MNGSQTLPDFLSDARLAPHAASASPAWLWSADGSRLLWANATGAEIFGAENVAAIAGRQFSPEQTAASQIARLAPTLTENGAPRLQRLRGFGAGFGRALLCSCSLIVGAHGRQVFVTAAEPVATRLSFLDRVKRLFAGSMTPAAIFTADGSLIESNKAGAPLLAHKQSIEMFGLSAVAQTALQFGHATGRIGERDISLDRLADGNAAFLLLSFPGLTTHPAPATSAPEQVDLSPVAQALAETTTRSLPERRAESRIADEIRPAFEPLTPMPAYDTQSADTDRHHPLRFVWQMDAEGRFGLGSGEFADVIGPQIATAFGRPWSEIRKEFGIDPQGEVSRAIASRDTWSGITLGWPVEGSDELLPVELSGLPVYDRERNFRGYRGFGVCRDLERIDQLIAQRFARKDHPPAPAVPDTNSRPQSTENILPFRATEAEIATKPAPLTQGERSAFREIASRLSARLRGADQVASSRASADVEPELPPTPNTPVAAPTAREISHPAGTEERERAVLDHIPLGVLIYRHSQFFYANPAFLQWSGCRTLEEFSGAGGLDTLTIETHAQIADANGRTGQALRLSNPAKGAQPVEAQLFSIDYDGLSAMALILMPAQAAEATPVNSIAANGEVDELRAMLDIATDGALICNRAGNIVQANAGAERLFGNAHGALPGQSLSELFAPDSARTVRDCLDWLARADTPRTLSEGRDVIGRAPKTGLIPLFMTMGRLDDGAGRFAVILRDLTAWKRTQEDLIAARRDAERASAAKSEFLAKISHEIRTPLNAIIGFSEVMMDERFGPVGNERYRAYLRDIHASGEHLISLLNDLLDLSKIEAGKLDLNFANVDLNELTQQAVAIMQPQAARERIILRTALAGGLPEVVADQRSVRQIVLNLLSNAVKFTGAGGQVIVSTAQTDDGQVTLRIRDSGAGMSEKDIQTALEPFRQLATSARYGSGGTGLGLPLTKALAQANRATFSIKSAAETGTLMEVAFPGTRKRAG